MPLGGSDRRLGGKVGPEVARKGGPSSANMIPGFPLPPTPTHTTDPVPVCPQSPGCPGWRSGHDPCPSSSSAHTQSCHSPSTLPSPPSLPWLSVSNAAASPLGWPSCLLLTSPHSRQRVLAKAKARSHCHTAQNPSMGLCHLSIRPQPLYLACLPLEPHPLTCPFLPRYTRLSPRPPCPCVCSSLCLECPSLSLLL